MTTLPDIPRLYTALAEVLAAVLYAQAVPPRMDKRLCWGITVVWAGLLAVFLQLTGDVPLVWWIPCMTAAIGWIYLYLMGHAGHEPAGSRVQLCPSVHFGRAGRQRGMAAALRFVAAAGGGQAALAGAAGGGLCGTIWIFVFA